MLSCWWGMGALKRGDQRAQLLWENPVYSCWITHFSILEKTLFPEEIGKLPVFNQLPIKDIFSALATSMTTIKCFSPVLTLCTLVPVRYTVAHPR